VNSYSERKQYSTQTDVQKSNLYSKSSIYATCFGLKTDISGTKIYQGMQCMYNITLRRVREIIFAVGKR